MSEPTQPKWYVVHTQPSAESRAAEHISRQGFGVYLPRYLKRRRHARRVESVAAPFFPRYLFVSIDVQRQRWRVINSTVGVSRLVTSEDGPQQISSSVVAGLKARENASGFIDVASPMARLQPGAPVRVVEGPFEACCGLFEALSDSDRVAILLDLLGRKTRVVLDAGIVEAA